MTKRTLIMVAMLFAFAAPGILGENPIPVCGPCGQKTSSVLMPIIRAVLPMALSVR